MSPHLKSVTRRSVAIAVVSLCGSLTTLGTHLRPRATEARDFHLRASTFAADAATADKSRYGGQDGGQTLGASIATQRIARREALVAGYRVVNVYPHDPNAYTQGLIYRDGVLFESTGLNGQSSLRKVKLETGQVLQQHRLDNAYFAEGLTELNGQLFQLTWRSNLAFVYEAKTFALQRTFNYSGEGWGLTQNQQELILSDGTQVLRFHDPSTFREIRRVQVTDAGAPVDQLNELEFVRGEIYANVWHTDRIARIAPQTGQVTGWIDLRGLLSPMYRLDAEAVLNGIAYDAARNRLFVTGKLWPQLFEIEVVPLK